MPAPPSGATSAIPSISFCLSVVGFTIARGVPAVTYIDISVPSGIISNSAFSPSRSGLIGVVFGRPLSTST